MPASIGSLAGAQRGAHQLDATQRQLQLTLARLASAQRLTSAADDPAGLVIAQQLDSQRASLDQVGDGLETDVALARTADDALGQTAELLQRQRDLALQAGNDATLSDGARAALDAQFQALGKAIDGIAANTRFGSTPLLDGRFDRQVQTGPGADQTAALAIASGIGSDGATGYDRQGLGLAGASLASRDDSDATLARLDAALTEVGRQRGDIGAFQAATLESGLRSLGEARQDLASALSVVADTDYAQASADRTRLDILAQAGVAVQAQRGLSAGNVLRLLT